MSEARSMSEMREANVNGSEETAQVAGATAGMLLRTARQAAGVHIAALAVALKVPVHKLEALEEERYEVFPDAVFVRALASSVCRALKVDPLPVLALLPHGTVPRLSADRGINASFKDGNVRTSSGGGSSIPRSVVAVVFVLLLAALAMVFVPRAVDIPFASIESRHSDATVGSSTSMPMASASMALLPASSSTPVSINALAAGQPQTDAPALAAAAVVAASQPAPTPVASDAVLVITATASSWVQVRNLSGGSTTQKILNAGDRLVAPGAPPWAVVIGKADATTVLLRGRPMDIASSTRENVARFEVK